MLEPHGRYLCEQCEDCQTNLVVVVDGVEQACCPACLGELQRQSGRTIAVLVRDVVPLLDHGPGQADLEAIGRILARLGWGPREDRPGTPQAERREQSVRRYLPPGWREGEV